MKNISLLVTAIIISISCVGQNTEAKKIEFRNPYKFSYAIEEKLKTDTISWKYQVSASSYAAKGDYKNALLQWEKAFGAADKNYSNEKIDSLNLKYKKLNAVNYIVEQAQDYNLVIINEAHHNSSHRAFTKSLLQQLFDNGYKNLGLEALANEAGYKDTLLNQRKYPIQSSGFYIQDPQFGDLVRTALEIGYHVFSYEQTRNSKNVHREVQQAKNIQEVMVNKPDEKILIHCGFDHALEGIHSSWEKAMAGRLAQFTGVNPLTINQVAYTEKSEPKFNHPLLKAMQVKEPIVLLDKEYKPFRYERDKSWTDIAVLHPNSVYKNGRPSWLFGNNNHYVDIDLSAIEISFPVMVLAYKKGEDINVAIPVDIIEVENKSSRSFLALKKGQYDVVIVNQKEDALKLDMDVK